MDEANKKSKWYYGIWFVILMLLLFGPLAFPVLWKSEKFSRDMKWLLTILVILMTVAALWGSVEIVKLVWKQFKELQATLAPF